MINSRRKGHSYEREICKALRKIFPDVERSLEGSKADQRGIDLLNTGDYAVQCKRGRNYAPINKIEEVISDKKAVLITRGDNKPSVAVLYFDNFLKLIGDLVETLDDLKRLDEEKLLFKNYNFQKALRLLAQRNDSEEVNDFLTNISRLRELLEAKKDV